MNKLFFPQVAEQTIYFPLFAEQSFFTKIPSPPPPPPGIKWSAPNVFQCTALGEEIESQSASKHSSIFANTSNKPGFKGDL